MSRVKENDHVIRTVETCLYNDRHGDAMIRMIMAISTTLLDISKSLAVIADNVKGGANNDV